MLTKIKNFVKRSFKKAKEVIDRVKKEFTTVVESVIDILDNPVCKTIAKETIKDGIVPLLAILLFKTWYFTRNIEETETKYYESSLRRLNAKREYLKAIDIQ